MTVEQQDDTFYLNVTSNEKRFAKNERLELLQSGLFIISPNAYHVEEPSLCSIGMYLDGIMPLSAYTTAEKVVLLHPSLESRLFTIPGVVPSEAVVIWRALHAEYATEMVKIEPVMRKSVITLYDAFTKIDVLYHLYKSSTKISRYGNHALVHKHAYGTITDYSSVVLALQFPRPLFIKNEVGDESDGNGDKDEDDDCFIKKPTFQQLRDLDLYRRQGTIQFSLMNVIYDAFEEATIRDLQEKALVIRSYFVDADSAMNCAMKLRSIRFLEFLFEKLNK